MTDVFMRLMKQMRWGFHTGWKPISNNFISESVPLLAVFSGFQPTGTDTGQNRMEAGCKQPEWVILGHASSVSGLPLWPC